MAIGDKYTHKITGERMEVKAIYDGVVTCWRLDADEEWSDRLQEYQQPVAIVSVENLIK